MRTVSITGTLDLREMPSGTEFELLAPLFVVWRDGERVLAQFEIPAGFTTDLSSVPQRLTSIIGKLGRYNKASVAHDWLYERESWVDGKPMMSRREADLLLRDAMRSLGVMWHRRWLMWLAARVGGGDLRRLVGLRSLWG